MKTLRERCFFPFERMLPLALVTLCGATAQAQFPGGPPQNLPPLEQRRAEVLKSFDADGDGKLSIEEREKARQEWRRQALSKREERGFFRPPPELMDEFDKNKDGELDDEENNTLRETMMRRFEQLNRDYDGNANGRLDPEEVGKASKDIDDGKLKGIPKMFLMMVGGGGPRGGRPGMRGPGGPGGPRGPGGPPGGDGADEDFDPMEVVRRADKNHDGRLGADEAETVRGAWAKRRAEKAKTSPVEAR